MQPERVEGSPAVRTVGDFELLSRIGSGGMAVVYRARQKSIGRIVALKCVARTGDKQAESRFAREISTLGRIEHPNLVKIYTSGSDDERLFYAMELIDGATLASVCEKLQVSADTASDVDLATWRESLSTACIETRNSEQPLSGAAIPSSQSIRGLTESKTSRATSNSYVRNIVELICQVADALHTIHEAGAVHRDIKPGNIMVTADGKQAVLMDLGLVQLADEVDGTLTRTSQFVGTLRYASPEQLLGRALQIDRRTDVYSLGATLWELLTLRPMFGAGPKFSTPELFLKIQGEEAEPIRKYHPEIDRDLDAIVLKCLEKARSARYSTVAELATDLRCWLRGERPRGVQSSRLRAGKKLALRHSRRVAVAGALVAALTVTALITARFAGGRKESTLPISTVVQTVPGLNGRWWFEEMPWLTPAVRPILGADLDRRPDREELKDLSGRDVTALRGQLRELVDHTPAAKEILVAELEKLGSQSLNGDALVARLNDLLHQLRDQLRSGEPRASDLHLQAALEHRIGMLSTDKGAAQRAHDLYERALSKYEANSPLHALCLSDSAQLEGTCLENYPVALARSKQAVEIPQTHPAFAVVVLCKQAEMLNAQGDFYQANEVYQQALERAKQLADSHPLAGFAHKSLAWNLLDHWIIEDARKHFKAAQDIQSQNSDLGNELAKIEYFHARHGLALAERYSGRAKLARESYRFLVEEIREEIRKVEQQSGIGHLSNLQFLRERLFNSLERCADCTLYEGAASQPWSNDSDLEVVRLDYQQSAEVADDPAGRAVVRYKWVIAQSLTQDVQSHQAAKVQYDDLVRAGNPGAGYDRERVDLLQKVASAVLQVSEQPGAASAGRDALQKIIDDLRNDPERKLRRETLELQIFCAELLVATALAPADIQRGLNSLGELVQAFPSQDQMQPYLGRYRQILSAQRTAKPLRETVPAEVATLTTGGKGNTPPSALRPAAPAGSKRAKLHLLAVGVSENQRSEFRLQFAHHDAEAMAALYSQMSASPSGAFDPGTLVQVTNEKASRSGILTELERLKKNVQRGDIVLATLSGHGVTNAAGNFFFLPYDLPTDFDEDRLRDRAISWAELGDSLKELTVNPGAAMTVLVMDACHSGCIVGTGARQAVLLDNEIGKTLQEFQNSSPPGMLIIGACRGNQTAAEDPAWKHGALTLSVLEAISGQRLTATGKTPLPDGAEKQGWVTLDDVVRYAGARVKELTAGKQRVVDNEGNVSLDQIPMIRRAAGSRP